MAAFIYSPVDFVFTCVGLPLFLLDIGLDVWAAVNFYQEEAFLSLAVLVLLLLGSSVLVQVYSWLWYSYENFEMETEVERCMSVNGVKLLHVLQLGIYLRHAGVLEVSVKNCKSRDGNPEDVAVFLSHDLSMLRIIETFSESAPQLVLMITIYLQEGRLDLVTVLKALGSISAVAFCVTTYHRSLRSFLPDKTKQQVGSSVVYFLWNLLLLLPRLVAMALFASVLPCFIFTHFLCSWLLLFFCAWRCQTEFMDSPGGEWVYRATVALIWYFDWFNVVEGKTRTRTLLYHTYILVDISILCAVWFWKMNTDPPHFVFPPLYATIIAVAVVTLYILGLLVKLMYYKFFHPSIPRDELRGESTETLRLGDQIDGPERLMMRSLPAHDVTEHSQRERSNKRMRKLAENFYS
ncbi:XK-related protein 8-like [Melanotaenia boesemani]|uniref:XK-related protein 8-like n=1 Tax=Melanotaenia boesemani TaxID=1250792 RepID=UPI001C052E48|nr:XK-related protein 8-like [Melanotaenia boesemani]